MLRAARVSDFEGWSGICGLAVYELDFTAFMVVNTFCEDLLPETVSGRFEK